MSEKKRIKVIIDGIINRNSKFKLKHNTKTTRFEHFEKKPYSLTIPSYIPKEVGLTKKSRHLRRINPEAHINLKKKKSDLKNIKNHYL